MPGMPGSGHTDPQLLMLNLSIFMNHYLLMSSFLVIPIMLDQFGVAIDDHADVLPMDTARLLSC